MYPKHRLAKDWESKQKGTKVVRLIGINTKKAKK